MVQQSRQPSLPNPTRKDIVGAVPIPQLKIAVGFVAYDKVDAWFCHDLAQLTGYTSPALLASGMDCEWGVEAVTATHIPRARQELLMHALDENLSHLLWIDADQRFPKDAFLRLMGHNKPIVGVNCASRGLPPRYTAIKHVGGEILKTTSESEGLEEVEGLGFACTLYDLRQIGDVIRSIPQPWFQNVYDPERKKWIGNDVRFCGLLRERGVKIYVDHDLSKQIGHTGVRTYWTTDVEEWEKLVEQGVVENGSDEREDN